MVLKHIRHFIRHVVPRIHLLDYLCVAVLGVLFVVLEMREPQKQLFSLDDRSLQFPFTEHERINNAVLLLLVTLVPGVLVSLFSLLSGDGGPGHRLMLLNSALVGLAMSLFLTATVTNVLKLLIGRPRPDFLARCIPKDGTSVSDWVSYEVCTNDDWSILMDGFKSCPSGHTSLSFAVYFYVACFVAGQMKVFHPGMHLYKMVIAGTPLLISTYVAISRIMDYRHHPTDVIFGSLLGCILSWLCYVSNFFLILWLLLMFKSAAY